MNTPPAELSKRVPVVLSVQHGCTNTTYEVGRTVQLLSAIGWALEESHKIALANYPDGARGLWKWTLKINGVPVLCGSFVLCADAAIGEDMHSLLDPAEAFATIARLAPADRLTDPCKCRPATPVCPCVPHDIGAGEDPLPREYQSSRRLPATHPKRSPSLDNPERTAMTANQHDEYWIADSDRDRLLADVRDRQASCARVAAAKARIAAGAYNTNDTIDQVAARVLAELNAPCQPRLRVTRSPA